MAAAGYRLDFSGKGHVSVETGPGDHGWNPRLVTAHKSEHHGMRWDAFAKLTDTLKPGAERGDGPVLRPGYPPFRLYGTCEETPNHHDAKVQSCGLDALDTLRDKDGPWCAYVGFIGPHDPYVVPSKYLDMYRLDDIPLPPSFNDSLADKPRVCQRMRDQVFGQLSPREVREGIRHFWAYCTWLDDRFGQLLAKLEATGQADNTLVLYTSDHGDYCGDHGLFAKGIPCYQGAYHVPAIVRWPRGLRTPGRRVSEFVSLADFAPTFLDLAGVKPERRFTGASLLPFIEGQRPATWRDEIHTQCNGVELYYTQRSVMTDAFKYVYNGFDMDELYDLQNDPHELRNLAGNPAYTGVVREMCGRLWRFARDEGDGATNPYITVGLAPFGPAAAFV